MKNKIEIEIKDNLTIAYWLMFLLAVLLVFSCEKEEQKNAGIDRITKIEGRDDIVLFIISGRDYYVPAEEKYLAPLRDLVMTRSVTRSTSTFSSNALIECDSLDLSHDVNTTYDYSSRTRENGMIEVRIDGDATLDSVATITGSLHPLGQDYIWNANIEFVAFGDFELGALKWVNNGESNCSTAQWQIVGKVNPYAHFYRYFTTLPLYFIEALLPDTWVYIMENRDHKLNDVSFKGGYAVADLIPLIQVQPNDFGEIGDLKELYNVL